MLTRQKRRPSRMSQSNLPKLDSLEQQDSKQRVFYKTKILKKNIQTIVFNKKAFKTCIVYLTRNKTN